MLSNALKFSPAYTEIKIQTSLVWRDQKPFAHFKILDQGPGILKEFQNSVFEKYIGMQMKKAGVTQVGLGLFLCKMVVEAHHGKIWFENNQPTGSIFCFEIPANHYQSV